MGWMVFGFVEDGAAGGCSLLWFPKKMIDGCYGSDETMMIAGGYQYNKEKYGPDVIDG